MRIFSLFFVFYYLKTGKNSYKKSHFYLQKSLIQLDGIPTGLYWIYFHNENRKQSSL
jgi:hypothetical protein